jgi:hypothetical protein
MTLQKFLGLVVLAEITLMLSRFITGEPLAIKLSDAPTLMAVMFGVSPYGRYCYDWVKEKIKLPIK